MRNKLSKRVAQENCSNRRIWADVEQGRATSGCSIAGTLPDPGIFEHEKRSGIRLCRHQVRRTSECNSTAIIGVAKEYYGARSGGASNPRKQGRGFACEVKTLSIQQGPSGTDQPGPYFSQGRLILKDEDKKSNFDLGSSRGWIDRMTCMGTLFTLLLQGHS